ncbi:MAG TPA: Ig-like domain-containing protein [bacterium]|nr:Ig-like domain-containing protein [bacterium]HQI48305.1 Ig-like domain-containing protein [bacterium]HQJ64195.1 Ig-like domain-containing protein [bacterium]
MKRVVNLRTGILVMLLTLIHTIIWAADARLKWQANSDGDLAGYRIHYGTAANALTQAFDAGNVTACTVTGLETGQLYYFALAAYDKANNTSALTDAISGMAGDTQAPTLMAAAALSPTELRVAFSEALEKTSAEKAANYTISPAVAVQSARLQSDGKSVVLTTTSHTAGTAYLLAVKGVKDLGIPRNVLAAGSTLAYTAPGGTADSDTDPPTITLARLTSPTTLSVYFSEPLDPASATALDHYHISSSVSVLSATLGSAGNVVQLTTSAHAAGQNYILTVNNVCDRSTQKNPLLPNSYYSYAYDPEDLIGPTITLVHATDADQVEILFNEPLDEGSAETTANYTIQGDVLVLGAELDPSGQIVRLRTSAHQTGRLYVLNVSNVRDASAQKNPVAGGTAFGYVFEPVDHIGPMISGVTASDATHLQVRFNETLDRNSAEALAHYQISDGVVVTGAALDIEGKTVTLETTAHTAGRVYVLVVNQVLDATTVGNEILPNSSYAYVYGSGELTAGPTIVRVTVSSATELKVEFSKSLEKASAEKSGNYQLNRGAAVTAAKLGEDGCSVTLTTSPHEAGKVYILTINEVCDATVYHRSVPVNSAYSYLYEGTDTLGPVISLVRVNDPAALDVMFNEQVSREEAERLANYQISGSITVLAAQLDGSQRIVHLKTTAHEPRKLYVLRISNVKDASEAANPIAANSSYSYLYEPADALPPTIALVRIIDQRHLEVSFSEAVDAVTAGTLSGYALSSGRVLKVTPGSAAHQYLLEVEPLPSGVILLLMVNGVRDAAGNTIAANSSYAFSFGKIAAEPLPAVSGVTAVSETQLYITFTMRLDKSTAENTANYQIQGIKVTAAKLDANGTRVWLTTSTHALNRIYVLLLSGIAREGRSDLVIEANTPGFYMVPNSAAAAPGVQRVTAAGEMLVEVWFNQAVERYSAENRRNYHISDDMAVLDAEMDADLNKVTLTTSRHQAGRAYTLTVSGVAGVESGTAISGAVLAYTFVPSLQVTLAGAAETNLSFVAVGAPYYVDRNYVITSAPEDLIHAKMIMTANGDKGAAATSFMRITVSQATVVYVAYDANAAAVPAWLMTRFTKTGHTLGVSESSGKLDLWAAYFAAGEVTLGGNNAAGARGAKCMYVVLLQEPAFARTLSNGELEGLKKKSAQRPTSVALLPNYPNPFNPRTSIRFELPYDKEVRLVVYDILGREVRTLYESTASAGVHALIWDGLNDDQIPVAAGVYIYRLEVWENAQRNGVTYRDKYYTLTRKMTYLK